MGERVAHLITSQMLDYIEFDDGFAIAKVRAPADAVGQIAGRGRAAHPVRHHRRRRQAPGEDFTYARPETVVPPGALLIVAGPTDQVERFAADYLTSSHRNC